MDATEAPVKRRFWQRQEPVEDRALTRATLPPVLFGDAATNGPVSPRAALAVADVYAAVRCIVDSVACLPLIAYRRVDDGRERDDGPLGRLLARPAPATPPYAFLSHLAASLVLTGDAFIALYRGEDGGVEQLGVLSSDLVTIEVKGGVPLYTITSGDGRRVTVGERDVCHVRSPLTVDGIRGLSPIRAARETVGLAAALGQQAASMAANDSRPSGILSIPPGPEAEDAIDRLASGWTARHGGPKNSGRIAVMRGDVKFSPVSMPASEMQFAQQRELSTAEVARIFRIPPWMLGAKSGDSLTYSNTESQAQAFVTFGLMPWTTSIEQSFSGHPELCPPGSNRFCEFLFDGILRADSKTRAEVYTAALNAETGWLTRAEVRRLENLPAEEVARA
ncbi:MAG: phage portal protein [Solirubrobacteraceae bacterium]